MDDSLNLVAEKYSLYLASEIIVMAAPVSSSISNKTLSINKGIFMGGIVELPTM